MLNQVLILLAILLMVGNNYAFDIPQALEVPLEREFHLTQTQFNYLYSIFAVPNIALSILGGIMIDKMGGRWGVFTFSFMLALSQLAIAFGGCYRKYYMMLVGRAIFGIASDMLHIAVFKIIAKRMPNNLGTAMGLVLTVPELAAALNSFLSPFLFEQTKTIETPLLFGLSLCIFSFLCGVGMVYLDFINDEANEKQIQVEDEATPEISFQFSQQFIKMGAICALLVGTYVPFLDNANKFYHERFGFSVLHAGRVVTIGYVVAALSSTIIGKIGDAMPQHQKKLIISSTIMFLISHLQFYCLHKGSANDPNYFSVLGLMTLGLSYAGYCAILMPALQQTVPESMLATALGIYGVAENISMALIPLISGFVYGEERKKDPMKKVDIIYLSLAASALALSFTLIQKRQKKIK